jgi:GNAT superfamily N-acetyltransferase
MPEGAGMPDRTGHPAPLPHPPAPRLRVREAAAAEIGALVPLLLLAEPSERALRWSLAHLSDAVYRADVVGDAPGDAAGAGPTPGEPAVGGPDADDPGGDDPVAGAPGAGAPAAAATLRWAGDPCEIVELAVDARWQGFGVGRAFLDWIAAEARRRGKREVEVGTANASLGNIAFYQRCGFRMHHVRRDYFGYYRTARVEHGIEVRDLLVFRREVR